mgnify:CR=1 FL=1
MHGIVFHIIPPPCTGSYLMLAGPEMAQTFETLASIVGVLRSRGAQVPDALEAALEALKSYQEAKAKVCYISL